MQKLSASAAQAACPDASSLARHHTCLPLASEPRYPAFRWDWRKESLGGTRGASPSIFGLDSQLFFSSWSVRHLAQPRAHLGYPFSLLCRTAAQARTHAATSQLKKHHPSSLDTPYPLTAPLLPHFCTSTPKGGFMCLLSEIPLLFFLKSPLLRPW